MDGIKNLLSSEHGLFGALLIVAATVLCGMRIMTVSEWREFAQIIFVAYSGTHAIVASATAFSRPKTGQPEPKKPEGGFVRQPIVASIAIMGFVCGGIMACISSAQTKSGETAAASCGVSLVEKYAKEVEGDLARANFSAALDDLKTKNNWTQDVMNCLIQTVVSIFEASQPTPMTGEPPLIVVNGHAYLAAHGAK